MAELIDIVTITTNAQYQSVFSTQPYPQVVRGGMLLTEQIPALNFRLRRSQAGYCSDWHVAGDPTLIAVLQGCLRISVRDGSYRDFMAGEVFIAQDYLPKPIDFDDQYHGHKAQLIGEQPLQAVHIKLSTAAL